MKRFFIILSSIMMLGLVGCTKDKWYFDDSLVPHVDSEFFEISDEDWTWNEALGRWYSTVPSNIDADLLEYGSITGKYLIKDKEGNEDYQAELPYYQTIERSDGSTYALLMGYEVSVKFPHDVTFFLQTSDFDSAVTHLKTYNFKLSYTWDRK